MLGLSSSAASLQMTQSCIVQSTRWKAGMQSRGTLTGMRSGPVWTSGRAAQTSAESFTWGRPEAKTQVVLRMYREQPWREKLTSVG